MDLYICKNARTVIAVDDNKQVTEYHMQVVNKGMFIKDDCNVIIDGKTIKANKGDLLICLYSPGDRFDLEYFIIPGTYFGDFLERTIAEEKKREAKDKACECNSCCDTCECFN
jgi:hypothetical protein